MKDAFCGWYVKCQSDRKTLAVIPAIHRVGGKRFCSLQLISENGSVQADFPYESFEKKGCLVRMGENRFDKKGMSICLHTADCSAEGFVRFGAFSPIRYDIMGPFCCIPFMECRHSVISMRHAVNGCFWINGAEYRFQNALGYIEGDRGRSFPREYAWTHCFFDGGSLMLSVADIPLFGCRFTGVIGIIQWKGKEYRLATYLGAKAVKIAKGEIVIKQGSVSLTVRLIEKPICMLRAPVGGSMSRIIRESTACRAFYCLKQNTRTLFSFETRQASFEYEYAR